jgi:hypothetical protein
MPLLRGTQTTPLSDGMSRPLEWLARMTDHIPDPHRHRTLFYAHYALLGRLAGAAHQTLRELMAAAASEGADLRIGMVAAVQTFGSLLNAHPHVHALATRGGWDRSGTWHGVPYVDQTAAELLFRHKVIKLLRQEGLLGEKRASLR